MRVSRRSFLDALSIATVLALIGVLTAPPVEAGPDSTVVFDPHQMHAKLMVEGGSDNASWVASLPCAQIHIHVDAYNDAAPWEDPPPGFAEDHFWPIANEQIGEFSTQMLNDWLAATGSDAAYTTKQTNMCSYPQEDGWLAASDDILAWDDDDHDWVIVIIDPPDTEPCQFGELLVASATYRYVWNAFFKGWYYYFGNNWIENPAPGTILSGNVDVTCVTVYDGDDLDEAIEAIPTTQVNTNPSIRGLTGLDTWLWYDFSAPSSYQLGPIDLTVNSRGMPWDLQVDAWVDRVGWDMDCVSFCDLREYLFDVDLSGYDYWVDFEDSPLLPAPLYYAGEEGEGLAAETHVYDWYGDYVVSTATVWRGIMRQTNVHGGGLGPPHIFDPVVVAASNDLPVISSTVELVSGSD